MPTYTIQLNDGRKVRVQANNPNDALAAANNFARTTPRQQAPAQRQDGQRNLADLISGRQRTNYVPPKTKNPNNILGRAAQAIDDFNTLAIQGMTFGQNPRIVGATGVVMGVPDAIRQRSLNPLAEAYSQNRQAQIDAIDAARRRMGLTGSVIETVASLPTGGELISGAGKLLARVAPRVAPRVVAALAPRAGPAAAKVARAMGRTAAAAGAGAVSGGVYGSGEGRAAENALYGAAGGALAAPIARASGRLANGVRRMVGRPNVAPEVKAARVLVGRVNPRRAQAQIDEAARLGQHPPALIDVSKNSGRRLVRGLAGNTTDDAQQMAVDYAATTREALPDRASGIVRRLTGRGVNISVLRQQGENALQAIDAQNYGVLEPLRITVDAPLLDDLATRQGVSAVNQSARASNTARRFDDEAALGRISEVLGSGKVGLATGKSDVSVSLQALEDSYRVMRDKAIAMMADESPSATRREGYALMQEANRLGQSLAGRFPAIANARMASQQARQNIEAIDLGFNAFTPNRVPSELAADIGQLPARQNVMAGAQARLEQQIGENPFAAVSALGYRPNMAARLNAMGAPADDMVSAARMETQRVRNADFVSPNTGSQPQLHATDMPDIGAVPTTPMGLATKLADFAFRRVNAFTDAEIEAIVRMGIEPADLPKLQALAARSPDQIPSVIKGLIGSSAGIGTAGQINAGTSQGYRQ